MMDVKSRFKRKNREGVTISGEDLDTFKDFIDPNSAYKFITHGWLSSSTSSTVENIMRAYLNSTQDVNIVTVNWEIIAGRTDYRVSASDTLNVGKELAKRIIFLKENNLLKIENVHLIGHSLGAHVSGSTGYYVKENGEAVSRITGLDPAGPGFELFNSYLLDPKTMALNKEHAKFVDIIHTSCGTLGYSSAIGHTDFYPNGGTHPMPGCGIYGFACSHARAHVYFGESIQYDEPNPNLGFWSKECQSFSDFSKGTCNDKEENVMGEYTDTSKSGVFYLATNANSPYALNGKQYDDSSSWFSPLNQLNPF
ncbi:lipoprotein lipase-like [Lycorma delicatula]|uniref:lipoprotein lipase-like n=1 Tax=Lycorma delicatula TaxID=130591 RepID=UPI003F51A009